MALPPGLEGWVLSQQQNRQRDQGDIQNLAGILSIQGALENQRQAALTHPLQLSQLQQAVQDAKTTAELRQRFIGILNGAGGAGGATGAMGAPTGATEPQLGYGGMSTPGGGQANALTGQTLPPQASAGGAPSPLAGVHPLAALAALTEKDLGGFGKLIQEANKPIAAREGAPIINPATGQIMFYAPKLETGMAPSFIGNQVTGVSNIPGYVPAMTERNRAAEGAKYVDVKIGDRPVRMTNEEYSLLYGPGSREGVEVAERYGIPYRNGPVPGAAPSPAAPAPPALGSSAPPAPYSPPPSTVQPGASGAAGPSIVDRRPLLGGGPRIPVNPTEAEAAANKERAIEQAKREGGAPQAALQTGSKTDSLDRLTDMADQVLKAPGLSRATGLFGALPSMPGGYAAGAEGKIESLKAQISGMALSAMRDASKTGGAVGAVTEKEWPRLEGLFAALNPRVGEAEFRNQIDNLKKEIAVSKQRIQDAYNQEYAQTPGAVPPASRENLIRRFNPATGRIE